MYPVSSGILERWEAEGRQLVKIYWNGNPGGWIYDSDIIAGTLTVDRYCISGTTLEIGSAIGGEMNVEFDNSEGRFSGIKKDDSLSVYIGMVDWEDETSEVIWVPNGTFYVDKTPRYLERIKISAFDAMVRYGKYRVYPNEYINPQTGTTLGQLMYNIAYRLVDTDLAGTFNANYNYHIEGLMLPPDTEYIDHVTLIRWCAFLNGSVAFFNGENALEFAPYKSASFRLTEGFRYSSDVLDEAITVTGLHYKGDDYHDYTFGDDTGLMLEWEGRIGILVNSSVPTIDVIENVFDTIDGLTYYPFTAVITQAPFLYPTDCIKYVKRDGTVLDTLITHITYKINQNTSIAATWDNNY